MCIYKERAVFNKYGELFTYHPHISCKKKWLLYSAVNTEVNETRFSFLLNHILVSAESHTEFEQPGFLRSQRWEKTLHIDHSV